MELCSVLCGSLDGRGVWGENGYVYMYGWVPSLFTWNYHNIVYWLSVSSVQFLSLVWLFATPWTAAHQASLSITNSYSCPSHRWCLPTISPSVVPFSSHLQSFPALGSFPMSLFFASGGQSIGVSASASVLPMNIQDWFPLGWTGWISLQSKGLSRVFSPIQNKKFKKMGRRSK